MEEGDGGREGGSTWLNSSVRVGFKPDIKVGFKQYLIRGMGWVGLGGFGFEGLKFRTSWYQQPPAAPLLPQRAGRSCASWPLPCASWLFPSSWPPSSSPALAGRAGSSPAPRAGVHVTRQLQPWFCRVLCLFAELHPRSREWRLREGREDRCGPAKRRASE